MSADRLLEDLRFWLRQFSSDPAAALTQVLLVERISYGTTPDRILIHRDPWTWANFALRKTQADHARKELMFFGAEVVPVEDWLVGKIRLEYDGKTGPTQHDYEGLA